MVITYIVRKKYAAFKVHVDGKVEMTPLANEEISTETLELLARLHINYIRWHSMNEAVELLADISVGYFIDKGYEVEMASDREIDPTSI